MRRCADSADSITDNAGVVTDNAGSISHLASAKRAIMRVAGAVTDRVGCPAVGAGGIAAMSLLVLLSAVAGAAEPAAEAQHDMLLFLPEGPVHLRVFITDGQSSLQQTRTAYINELVATLDTDMDGKLSRTETTKHPLFVSGRRFDGNAFLSKLRQKRPLSRKELELAVARAAGQPVTYRQNNALADQDLTVFNVLDTDGSGLIDRTEMRLAPANIAERDVDFDQCITFDEFLDEQPQAMTVFAVQSATDEPPASVQSQMLRDATEPILAARMVRLYDDDRNAHLTHDELGWPENRVKDLDEDKDGRLSMQELGRLSQAHPDIVVSVDLSLDASAAMTLVGEKPTDVIAARSDLIRIKRNAMSLSIGYRHRDPLQEAEQNASATFNAIDLDTNGYLDRDEVAEHQRFARYLFDAMDRDEDDRVFAEEMMAYVKDYTRPASTTCQVTVLDTGNGFFQLLDVNGDGRISVRELRQCEDSLLSVAEKEKSINPSRLKKSYRIEIQRGGVGLFGRVDRPTAETPAALLKPPSGPIWFQRMDRNGDGDLTWDEFLGPRDVFHEIDADADGLIDESEARSAA